MQKKKQREKEKRNKGETDLTASVQKKSDQNTQKCNRTLFKSVDTKPSQNLRGRPFFFFFTATSVILQKQTLKEMKQFILASG